ncbi:hypothetical protein T01_13148 [Trichinella spiralis]|uniref:Uncharacterized protein n=3 Tax=Trichinella TaxID=6333 RepID=A0A0V1B576_TRISP|nr:hypothetical protein T01_13148 [Trichinella spiralis]
MANMIFPYQLILHDLHRYELTQHWPFVTSVNMVTYFIHCAFVMKNLSRSTSANRIFSNTRKNAKSPPLCWAGKKRTISPSPWSGEKTKLPAHLRQVKQLSLTRLFSAESLGFPRSREGERALCLPKEQGRVCTLPCLREGSFTLQDGAHFRSLHPPPALNIQVPLWACLPFRRTHLCQTLSNCCCCCIVLVMANMIFPYQLILHDLHRYELTQHWPFVTSVNMVTYFIHCVFVMKNLSRSTSANRIFSNVSILTSIDQQTIRANLSTIRSLARDLLHFSSFFSMCITLVCLMDSGKVRSIKSGLRAIEILPEDELLPSRNIT